MKALQHLLDGNGYSFSFHVTRQLLQLLLKKALTAPKLVVRETG